MDGRPLMGVLHPSTASCPRLPPPTLCPRLMSPPPLHASCPRLLSSVSLSGTCCGAWTRAPGVTPRARQPCAAPLCGDAVRRRCAETRGTLKPAGAGRAGGRGDGAGGVAAPTGGGAGAGGVKRQVAQIRSRHAAGRWAAAVPPAGGSLVRIRA